MRYFTFFHTKSWKSSVYFTPTSDWLHYLCSVATLAHGCCIGLCTWRPGWLKEVGSVDEAQSKAGRE